MNFRPCIDLHEGKVKQIVGSSLNDRNHSVVENFISEKSPAWYAELFKKDGLKGGHVIMLGPGNQDACLTALKAWQGGLQAGGGITPENAGVYLDAGASHVIVTSYVFKNGRVDFDRLQQLIATVGKERLVLDISCRKRDNDYYVVTDRWQKWTEFKLDAKNISLLESFCDELLIHGVDVEGKRSGIDKELVEFLGTLVNLPSTYAGGISSLEDILLVNELSKGKLNVTIGSALDIYGGNLNYQSILNTLDILNGMD